MKFGLADTPSHSPKWSFLSFVIGREISWIKSELPFSKLIFRNSQVFSKRERICTGTRKYMTCGEKQFFWRLTLVVYNDGRGDARTSAMRSHKLQQLLVCNLQLSYKYQGSFLGPRGPLVEPSISPSRPPVPSRNNFSWVHRWAVTLLSGLRYPSNRIFSQSWWCQLSKLGQKYKYKDKYTDKYKDRGK